MKKNILILAKIMLVSTFFFGNTVYAGGGNSFNLKFVNVSPAVTGSEITVEINTWTYQCNATDDINGGYKTAPVASVCDYYTPSGTRGTVATSSINKLQMSVSGGGNTMLSLPQPTGTDGRAIFRFKTTEAGQKTLSFLQNDGPVLMGGDWETKTITITAPAATAAAKTTTTTAATKTTAVPAATPTKPATPNITEFVLDNQKTELKTGEVPAILFNKDKGVKFSGTTIPNGKVTLYFQSEPFSDTVTADANGVWSYLLIRDLGEGEHSLETTVTDTVNNVTSDKSQAVKFALSYEGASEATENIATPAANTRNYTSYYVGGGIALALAIGGGAAYYLIRKKKATKKTKEDVAETTEIK